MAELDGVWEVKRTGGLLPPLVGVRKRIEGDTGRTVAPGIAAGFDVVGLELRYRGPLAGLVDVLERAGDGYRGRTSFRGRELGTFALTRTETADDVLVGHLDEAYALERSVLRLLESAISTTEDEELRGAFERHRTETEAHADRIRERLEAHGTSPSAVRQLGGVLGALAKTPLDLVRGAKSNRGARDAYAAEHLEIASYELLRRAAERAGDSETVAACDAILVEERAMAETVAGAWDRLG